MIMMLHLLLLMSRSCSYRGLNFLTEVINEDFAKYLYNINLDLAMANKILNHKS